MLDHSMLPISANHPDLELSLVDPTSLFPAVQEHCSKAGAHAFQNHFFDDFVACCLHLLALFFGKHSRLRCACHCSSERAISNMSRTSEMMSCKTRKANECVDVSNLCRVQACRLQACLFKNEWIY